MTRVSKVLILMLLAALECVAQAPSGFRSFRDPSGASFYAPTDFAQVPLQPTESVIRARFRRKTLPDEIRAQVKKQDQNRADLKPIVDVFMFRRSGGTTPGPETEAKTEVDPARAKNYREAMEHAGQVSDFVDFRERRLRNWDLDEVPNRERHYTMAPKAGVRFEPNMVGYLVLREERGWIAGAYGIAHSSYQPKIRSIILQIVQSLTLPEHDVSAEGVSSSELDRLYPPGKWRAVESRKRIRRSLARGWKAIDTENFIVVHHSDSEKLVNKVARDVEAMRAVYAELFPAIRDVDEVSIVRICKDREEYLAYGGPPRAGGHWSPGNEELVFYDYYQTTLTNSAKGIDARRTTDRDSYLVLYHEAFHQYIHYAVGEIAPHDWFNEGHGDYFSGAVIPQYGTKVQRLGPSPWRLHRAKDQFENEKVRIPLERLVRASRSEYYNPIMTADFYAAGWSFVYFLRESEKVKKHPRWSKLLDDYFNTLTTSSKKGLERLGADTTLADRMRIQETAREHALKAFLEDLDLSELEAEWKDFIIKLKDPWPHLKPARK